MKKYLSYIAKLYVFFIILFGQIKLLYELKTSNIPITEIIFDSSFMIYFFTLFLAVACILKSIMNFRLYKNLFWSLIIIIAVISEIELISYSSLIITSGIVIVLAYTAIRVYEIYNDYSKP